MVAVLPLWTTVTCLAVRSAQSALWPDGALLASLGANCPPRSSPAGQRGCESSLQVDDFVTRTTDRDIERLQCSAHKKKSAQHRLNAQGAARCSGHCHSAMRYFTMKATWRIAFSCFVLRLHAPYALAQAPL